VEGEEEEFHINIKIYDSKQQKAIENILADLRKDFPFMDINIDIKSRKLIPFEVSLEIVMKIVAEVATKLMIKFLKKLWEKFKQNGITPKIEGLDIVQKKAENYLREIGVLNFEILKREDKGLYVFFIFKDYTNILHHLYITSFDLRIIEYERRG